MVKVMKECRLDIDYCACMVAIALYRHIVDENNIGNQLSAENLTVELNLLPFSNGPNFNVNPLGLKHGFQLFGAYLKEVGISMIPMYSEDLYLTAFFQLESCKRSTEVKFSTFTNPSEDDTEVTLLSAVMSIRDQILKRSRYTQSIHPSPSSVFGSLHYSAIVGLSQPKSIPKLRKRKSPSELRIRAINNCADKIIASADTTYGDEHSLFYLESAVRKAKKRKMKHIVNNNNNAENSEKENEDSDDENDDNDDGNLLQNLGVGDMIYDPRVLIALSNIPAKYVIFSDIDKNNVTALYKVVEVVAIERDYRNSKLAAAVATKQILKDSSYYANISTRTIMRWVRVENAVSLKPGRKISEEFENEVWGNLMLCIFEKNDIEGSADNIRIIVNVTYSYAIIGSAARSVQERQQWVLHPSVSSLQFTNKWVKAFLNRGGLTRRKITRDDKDVPEDDEISQIMGVGQRLFVENGHDEHTCYNFDETAYTWGLAPIHSYCPKNQQRATNIGITDTKVRITAVIAVNAAGVFAPLMLILKHSKSSEKSPDQTKMTVINKLHKVEGFTEQDGWTKHTWSKKLTMKGKLEEHKVTYIIHNITKHVITSQVKAWNDTVRMIMWYELVVKPIKEERGRVLLWCDNCGSHKTTSVQQAIAEVGVDVAFLPKNMTGELQVLDLVVNGPLKAHIRTNRANRLYSHFQKYRVSRAADSTLPVNERMNLDFDPPKPTLVEGMKDLFLLFEEQMKEDRFKSTIKRSFVKTGTYPTYHEDPSEPPAFAAYRKESTWGTMNCIPTGTLPYTDEENNEVVENEEGNEDEGIVRAILAYHENQESEDDNDYEGEETESDEE